MAERTFMRRALGELISRHFAATRKTVVQTDDVTMHWLTTFLPWANGDLADVECGPRRTRNTDSQKTFSDQNAGTRAR